jgi:hypothetical protein
MATNNYSIWKQLQTSAVMLSSLIAMHTFAAGDTANSSNPAYTDEQQAMALAQQFAAQLKPKLQGAISTGGPVYAIDVCATEAPNIAAELSAQSGWKITRVSSRNRNPNAVPDAWEAVAITTFERQLEEGADPTTLKLSETTVVGYRFAKPLIVEPLCLTCHGKNIAPEVSRALASHYPQDHATGYDTGQIRGIISLSKPR